MLSRMLNSDFRERAAGIVAEAVTILTPRMLPNGEIPPGTILETIWESINILTRISHKILDPRILSTPCLNTSGSELGLSPGRDKVNTPWDSSYSYFVGS